jgi:hypothetical protein
MLLKHLNELIPNLRIDLNVLKRDTERYKMLLYQHTGVFTFSEYKIGNQNFKSETFDSVLEILKNKKPDLFLTPEYSIPLDQILRILSDPENQPTPGKLWVICGESISIEELGTINAMQSDDLLIHHEKLEDTSNNFLNPLFYIFRGNHQEKEKLVVLVQFKTKHMGVWSKDTDVERNNLIRGKIVYVLSNPEESISLFSLICSDALDFKAYLDHDAKKYLDWTDKPFLILSPQFNPKPNHKTFIEFRQTVFEAEKKEIIALNWNVRSLIGNHSFATFNVSRSGIYLNSSEIDFKSLSRIKSNHQKGLYYFNNKNSKHIFLFNSTVDAYFVANLPVHISGVPRELAKRDGPEVLAIFRLDQNDKLSVSSQVVDDQHIAYLRTVNCANEYLLDESNCVTSKEILSCITSGRLIKVTPSWFHFDSLETVVMSPSDELNLRITVGDDREEKSETSRITTLESIIQLDKIFKFLESKPDELPECVANLAGKQLRVGFHKDCSVQSYKYNVLNKDGSPEVATFVYLGPSTPTIAGQKLEEYQKLHDFNNKDRVVVYFLHGGELAVRAHNKPGDIHQNDNDFDQTSIFKN